jgi:RNA polymerase sigma factor FliA
MKQAAPQAGLKLLQRPKQVEASLWRRFRFERDIACREALFNRYHKLAGIIARHEFRRRPPYGLERQDFEQLAYGGLLEAIDRFDPLRGAPFEAYARHRIRGAISDGLARSSEIASQYSHRRRQEMERLASVAAGPNQGSGDFISDLASMATLLAIGWIAEEGRSAQGGQASPRAEGYDTLAWRELEISVTQEIERLPEMERSVVHQHYINGLEFKKIAELLGLSKGRISQIHRAALERIRTHLLETE